MTILVVNHRFNLLFISGVARNNNINILCSFIVGTLLTALVRQGDFSGIVQKICAYFIMQDLFQENGKHKFLSKSAF